MMELIEPCETYLASYREAFEEFRAMGVSTYGLTDPDSCNVLGSLKTTGWSEI